MKWHRRSKTPSIPPMERYRHAYQAFVMGTGTKEAIVAALTSVVNAEMYANEQREREIAYRQKLAAALAARTHRHLVRRAILKGIAAFVITAGLVAGPLTLSWHWLTVGTPSSNQEQHQTTLGSMAGCLTITHPGWMITFSGGQAIAKQYIGASRLATMRAVHEPVMVCSATGWTFEFIQDRKG